MAERLVSISLELKARNATTITEKIKYLKQEESLLQAAEMLRAISGEIGKNG